MVDVAHPASETTAIADPPTEPITAEPPGRRYGWVGVVAPLVTAALTTLWVFRSVVFGGRLMGDIGDARWTVALHEHWYRVWQGLDSVRNMQYYFPLSKTLGTSDAFLVQGQLYSVARLLGFDLVNAWVLAEIAFFLLGAAGVALLSTRILGTVWMRVAFVALVCASYPVYAGAGHVQLIGFLSASWVVLGVLDIVAGRTTRGIVLLAIVPPLLALSSWYAMVLLAIVLAFLAVFAAFTHRVGLLGSARTLARAVWRSLLSVWGAISVVLAVCGWAAVLWVYLPSRGLLPRSEWFEVVGYSPQWSDIWNASADGGGIWASLYARIYEPGTFNWEQAWGFTPILFAAFVVAGLMQLGGRDETSWSTGRSAWPGRATLLACWLAVFAAVAFFLADRTANVSLFKPFWSTIPGLESIRSPFRVQALTYALALFVVLRSVERGLTGWRPSRGWLRAVAIGLAAVIGVGMFVEMQRPMYAQWTREQFLPATLAAQVDAARGSCDAVIVVQEDVSTPEWVTAVDAVAFSAVSGLPTPQGYSRTDPADYPGVVDTGFGFAPWMRDLGFDGRLCRVSSRGVELVTEG